MPLNFDDIILEKEQKDLLIALVETDRQQPRDRREDFMIYLNSGQWRIYGLIDYLGFFKGDIDILTNTGLLTTRYDRSGTPHFIVTTPRPPLLRTSDEIPRRIGRARATGAAGVVGG